MIRKTPHLTAFLLVLGIVFVLLGAASRYAKRQENLYVHALAVAKMEQAHLGIAFQRSALRYSDLLPIYGSSELTEGDPRYQARSFFRKYPTGFMVFQVAKPAANSLTIAQAVSALGPGLRGKKIIISFTPALFQIPMLDAGYYAGNFSRLHAYEITYHPLLTWDIKRRAALRMLDYPKTLQQDPILLFSLRALAGNSPLDRALYISSLPLGRIVLSIIHLQDHAAAIQDISGRRLDPLVYRKGGGINWKHYFKKALQEQIPLSNNNPYGIDNRFWDEQYKHLFQQPIPPGSADAEFLTSLDNSEEWDDLKILLEVLQELGAEPLLLSRPLNSPFFEALGVSRSAQAVYYEKLQATVAPYGFPLVDFHEIDTLPYFSVDRTSHPSLLGWIYVNQAIDDFYHNRIQKTRGDSHGH